MIGRTFDLDQINYIPQSSNSQFPKERCYQETAIESLHCLFLYTKLANVGSKSCTDE